MSEPLKAAVNDRFIESREELKVLYKEILVSSYDIWTSQFAQLQAREISEDDKDMHRIVRARWLSSRANNTNVSVLSETIDEADIDNDRAEGDEDDDEEDEERDALVRQTRARASRQKWFISYAAYYIHSI